MPDYLDRSNNIDIVDTSPENDPLRGGTLPYSNHHLIDILSIHQYNLQSLCLYMYLNEGIILGIYGGWY